MSAPLDLAPYFFEMEKLVEAQPDSVVLMGVGWLWLLDPDTRTVETFASVRSKMIAGPAFGASDHVSAPPFESLRLPLDSMFPSG